MRSASVLFVLIGLVGCGDDSPCGERDGEEIVGCVYDQEDGATGDDVGNLYCPDDNFGSSDGCNSCACFEDDVIVCTQKEC